MNEVLARFEMSQIDLEATRIVSRMEAVEEQLDVAIDLFFDGRFLASITLAAAAERVLSDLLKDAGQPASADVLRTGLEQGLLKAFPLKNFNRWRHEVYDWLRHADRQPQATQEVTPCEALILIMCGILLFLRMKGHSTASMQRFRQYCLANVPTDTQPD